MNTNRLLVTLIAILLIGTTMLVALGMQVMKQRREVRGVGTLTAVGPVAGGPGGFSGDLLENSGVAPSIAGENMGGNVGGDVGGGALDIALPVFELTDHRDQVFRSDSLLGKVWVVDFVFTTCPGLCPAMSMTMERLQRDLRERPYWDDLRLVSISVDPEQDTPAALRDYAARYHADEQNWIFLTGERASIWDLVEKGFLLEVGDSPEFRETGVGNPIVHSPRFGLVDQHGKLQGYFNVLQASGYEALLAAIDVMMGQE